MNRFITYLKDVRQEMTHVTWPAWSVAIAHAVLVLAFAGIVAAYTGALDALFGLGIEKLLY